MNTMSHTVRKKTPIALAVILFRLRPTAISDAIVYERVPMEKLKKTTLKKAKTTMAMPTPLEKGPPR